MQERFNELLALLQPVQDLQKAAELLEWDQETYMPEGAAEARARQVATLRKLAHERFTDDRIGALLQALDVESLGALSFKGSLARVALRDFERACKIPSTLVAALATTSGRAKEAWRTARASDDYSAFAPHLERIIDLNIEKAEALGYEHCPYDALLDEYEPGMTTHMVAGLFGALRKEIVPIVQAIAEKPRPEDAFLFQSYDSAAQWDFGMEVLRKIGYDFHRGRQDVSTHPFSTSLSITDVRITTRLQERYLPSALFSTLHEAGHALYEQGIDRALEGTLLAEGTSLGMHESQSRLWENQIGRSRAFWEYYYGDLQARFAAQLSHVSPDAFYRAINAVRPSLIRVEADEVTYNLHIMLRFELERLLVERRVSVQELPELWNVKMEEYLGVRPETYAEGVLQDIHWSLGAFGYFPTYALGNLMSAQLFESAQKALPDLDQQVARGEFSGLRAWLQNHVHQFGRRLTVQEIIQRTTGGKLSAGPWLAYVRRKFEALYGQLH